MGEQEKLDNWEMWVEHGVMRAKIKGKACEKCGGDDFIARMVDGAEPPQKDMVFSCVKCEWAFNLVNVYPIGMERDFGEADGMEAQEIPVDLEVDPGMAEALERWRLEIPEIQSNPMGFIDSGKTFKALSGKSSGTLTLRTFTARDSASDCGDE